MYAFFYSQNGNRTMSREFILSTTTSIENHNIVEYLGVESAHIVAGTNLFSDMAGDLRDIFGGRSKSYQRQLAAIEKEAIDNLKNIAINKKANAIVGLRIDHDDVSGRGRQMFMVTASGTLVRIIRKGENDSDDLTTEGRLSSHELSVELKKKKILSDIKNNKYSFIKADWSFFLNEEFYEVLPLLFEELESQHPTEVYDFLKELKRVCIGLDKKEKVKDYLYARIERNTETFYHYYRSFIKEGEFMDLVRVNNMLLNDDINIQKCAVELLRYDKEFYNPYDVYIMQEIIGILNSAFPDKSKIISKKSMLGKTNDYWVCGFCGNENPTNVVSTTCNKCSINKWGFYHSEFKPDMAADLLNSKIESLKEYFNLTDSSANN